MTDDPRNEIENDPVFQQAADWLVRLQEPTLSLDETMEWQRWMNADPRHARSFERVEQLWGKLERVEWPAPGSAQAFATQDYDGSESVTASPRHRAGKTSQQRASRSRRRASGGNGRPTAAWSKRAR